MKKIPMVNLQPLLDVTAPQWRYNLDEMFSRAHFILGTQVAAFEREFAAEVGAKFAVGVGTGTAAIELCLREAGITDRKQEVVTSALTSPFTALAVLTAGATPRFADVEEGSLQIDCVDAACRATKRTAAFLPVHLYGQPCDLDHFRSLARALKAPLVQDACQAHGARYKGRPLTEFSPYVAYSFYPTKNLGCLGDGGAVATNRPAVAKRLAALRDGGRHNDQVSRMAAINSRLDELQACYLRAFLPRLAEWNADRRRLAAFYDDALRDVAGLRLVKRWPCSVSHLYVVRAARRDKLREHLAKQGIMTAVHYPVPLHLQPAFRDCGLKRGALPRAEKACREIVSLPLWPYMAKSDAERVADRVRAFYR
jgi:dTDP-3-amino-3,4,6-trideoxy-alpha-D-glucose transaminase